MIKKLTENKRILTCLYFLILAGVALIASLPAFRNGIYNGHDLWFHMGRIEAIATELSNGQFPVRFETTGWYGNGYISTTMYGNIFLYVPALLHMAGLATYRCYNIYVILTNIIGVAIAAYSFKGIFKDRRWALLATSTYMLAGYYISNVYMRAAVGEYTAMIFIPLLVYGIYHVLFDDNHDGLIRTTLPLVIGTTGIIESHILTTVMVALAVFVFLIIYLKTTIGHIKELLFALVMIVCLNAFFLVPFLDSYTSYQFNASVGTAGENIQKFGLYLDQVFGLFPEGSGSMYEWTSAGEEYTRLGVVHVVAFALMLFAIAFKKKLAMTNTRYRRILSIFIIGLIAAWLSSAYFPWGIFSGDNAVSNIMRSVQYPSRYLVIQTICWTLCGTYALRAALEAIKPDKQALTYGLAIICIGMLALAQTGWFMYTLSCRNYTIQTIEGRDNFADGLYLQVGTDTSDLATEAELLEGDDCTVQDLGYSKGVRQILIDNESTESATVLVPIFNFKYIRAFDSAGTEYQLESTDGNQYQVQVPAGFNDTMSVKFVAPFAWRFSEGVTLITLLAIIFVPALKRGRKGV